MPKVDRKIRARSKYKVKRKFYGNQHKRQNITADSLSVAA